MRYSDCTPERQASAAAYKSLSGNRAATAGAFVFCWAMEEFLGQRDSRRQGTAVEKSGPGPGWPLIKMPPVLLPSPTDADGENTARPATTPISVLAAEGGRRDGRGVVGEVCRLGGQTQYDECGYPEQGPKWQAPRQKQLDDGGRRRVQAKGVPTVYTKVTNGDWYLDLVSGFDPEDT
jgi:hypothetical protein